MTDSNSTTPIRATPFPPLPPRFEGAEIDHLRGALNQNSLLYLQQNGYVNQMLARACDCFGADHAVATTSGTAALHVAIAAAGVEAGGEVILPGITDFGTVIGILYQNAIPVFADVDPDNSNLTAATIDAAITNRTQAVITVHLAGVPCEMAPIVALCKERGIPLIEDCAQAYGSRYDGQHVGTLGDIGAFSLNDYKVLSSGDGGFCITNNNAYYQACHLYADKYYDRLKTGVRMHGLAPNYRMSELQGAVGLAQLNKLDQFTQPRIQYAAYLNEAIGDIPGIVAPKTPAGSDAAMWFYMFRVNEQELGQTREQFVSRLQAEGLPAGGGYLGRPLYKEHVFQTKNFFAGGVWPAELVAGKQYDYTTIDLPGTNLAVATCVRLPLHQGFTQSDVDDYARAIRKAATP